MPVIKRTLLKFLPLFGISIATINGAAGAHGVVTPLPVGHALATSNALKTLLLHKHATVLPFTGAGSSTVRINNQVIKSIITNGYSNGQSIALRQAVGGAISSGNLSGRLYFATGSVYGNLGLQYSIAIGGAPATGIGVVSGTLNTSNSLNFTANTFIKQHNIGSVLPYSAGLSGAEKARTALYKTLTTSSTSAGEKSITTLGPITGGQLYGTFGEYNGGGLYTPYTLAAYAFGSSPYNSSTTGILPTSALRNYLTFANGLTRTVTGGQFTGVITSPFILPGSIVNYGTYGLAFGNSPFNNGVLYTPYNIALLKNVFNLAVLK